MTHIKKLQGNDTFLQTIKNKRMNFYLTASYSQTAEIPGITVAGLPGYIAYTPALDMEVLYYGVPKSMPDIPVMPEGPPSPVLLSSVVHSLAPFSIRYFDVGLRIRSQAPSITIDATPSASILEGAKVEAERLYEEGKRYAEQIIGDLEVFYLAECVPSGTTTAYAVTRALGYDCDSCFSSSHFDPSTYSLKRNTVESALEKYGTHVQTPWDAVRWFGDNMQPFVCGLAERLSQEKKVILAGGTQMAAVYALLKNACEKPDFGNMALFTTRWIVEDDKSDIAGLMKMIDPELNVFYADFSLSDSTHENLRLYEEGYVKEGAGCGALLCHADLNDIDPARIVNALDAVYRRVTGEE